VRQAITWKDHCAEAEARLLGREFGSAERLFGASLPAVRAPVADGERGAQRRAHALGAPAEVFAGLRITGSENSDPWSSKGICRVRTHAATKELFLVIGLIGKVEVILQLPGCNVANGL
jgi:hypothetical protein